MSEQLLTILKLCLLALLYLFFFRVLRAVWAELRSPVTAAPAPTAPPRPAAPAPGTAPPQAPQPAPASRRSRGAATELVIVEPAADAGRSYAIADELTVGRAPGCAISLPTDTYVSTLHARIFRAGGEVKVEDLGSTNGTYLNRSKIGAPAVLQRGDRLQVGTTTLEAR